MTNVNASCISQGTYNALESARAGRSQEKHIAKSKYQVRSLKKDGKPYKQREFSRQDFVASYQDAERRVRQLEQMNPHLVGRFDIVEL